MSGKAIIRILCAEDRARARMWVDRAPGGTSVEFKAATRTLPQNDRMWAMLTDIATQKKVNGKHHSTDQLKALFMHACGQEVEFLQSLDGNGWIPWGRSSSKLTVEQMSDLIEFMFAWGAENGIAWTDPRCGEAPKALPAPAKQLTHQREPA